MCNYNSDTSVVVYVTSCTFYLQILYVLVQSLMDLINSERSSLAHFTAASTFFILDLWVMTVICDRVVIKGLFVNPVRKACSSVSYCYCKTLWSTASIEDWGLLLYSRWRFCNIDVDKNQCKLRFVLRSCINILVPALRARHLLLRPTVPFTYSRPQLLLLLRY